MTSYHIMPISSQNTKEQTYMTGVRQDVGLDIYKNKCVAVIAFL